MSCALLDNPPRAQENGHSIGTNASKVTLNQRCPPRLKVCKHDRLMRVERDLAPRPPSRSRRACPNLFDEYFPCLVEWLRELCTEEHEKHKSSGDNGHLPKWALVSPPFLFSDRKNVKVLGQIHSRQISRGNTLDSAKIHGFAFALPRSTLANLQKRARGVGNNENENEHSNMNAYSLYTTKARTRLLIFLILNFAAAETGTFAVRMYIFGEQPFRLRLRQL